MFGLILVVDQLSPSIHSSNTAVATRGCWGTPWPQQALVHLKCPACLSGRLCLNGRMDECWQALVLHFLQTAHLSSALGNLSRKTKCPSLPPMPNQATWWGSGQPLKCVYLEEVPNFFSGGLVPYQLDSRCIHLRVQPWKTMPVAMAN